MAALVTDLVGVVSTSISGQTAHLSLQSLPPQPRSFIEPEMNRETSFKPPTSPPSKAAINIGEEKVSVRKDEASLHIAEVRKESKEKMEQQQ